MKEPAPKSQIRKRLFLMGVVLFGLLFLAIPAAANEQAQEHVHKGNEAYEAGDFETARRSYEKAVNEGLINPVLYYNYANSLFRLNQLGRAILYYEKALLLDAGFEDARANLQFAKAQTIDKHPEPETGAITKILNYLHTGYSLDAALWLLLAVSFSFFALLTWILFLRKSTRWLLYPLLGVLVLAGLVMTPSIALRMRALEHSSAAIVLSPTASIHSGPGDTYEVLAKVHEGTKFTIVEKHGDWLQVMLPNGTGGYVTASGLGEI